MCPFAKGWWQFQQWWGVGCSLTCLMIFWRGEPYIKKAITTSFLIHWRMCREEKVWVTQSKGGLSRQMSSNKKQGWGWEFKCRSNHPWGLQNLESFWTESSMLKTSTHNSVQRKNYFPVHLTHTHPEKAFCNLESEEEMHWKVWDKINGEQQCFPP